MPAWLQGPGQTSGPPSRQIYRYNQAQASQEERGVEACHDARRLLTANWLTRRTGPSRDPRNAAQRATVRVNRERTRRVTHNSCLSPCGALIYHWRLAYKCHSQQRVIIRCSSLSRSRTSDICCRDKRVSTRWVRSHNCRDSTRLDCEVDLSEHRMTSGPQPCFSSATDT